MQSTRFVRPSASTRFTIILSAIYLGVFSASAETVWLSSLDLSHAKVTDNVRVTSDKNITGQPLTIHSNKFERGISAHGYTVIYVKLAGGSDRFSAILGVDDEAPPAPVTYEASGPVRRAGAQGGPETRSMSVRILAEQGRVLYENNSIAGGTNGIPIEVDTKGVGTMAIVINNGASGRSRRGGASGYYNLADAKFEVSGAKPVCVAIPGESREVLTPKAGPAPRINGPELTGVSPNKPVLYKIPASGKKPMIYSVDKLPKGLVLDRKTGIITGKIQKRGTYPVTFRVKNSSGTSTKKFKFVAEGTLALTPTLGWNSWNARGRRVTDELIRKTADAFVEKGLIDHGWDYICIDDGWERSPRETDELYEGPTRDEKGRFLTNKKFPDMKALGDYVHSKGLKYGIYSSPGPTTCQGLEGSFNHEEQDVMQFVEWGVDYLKYDLCSYRPEDNSAEAHKKPYRIMRAALDKAPRDIIYSICQYGRANVWEWGNEPDIRGNLWRTTQDIRDNWVQTRDIGFNPRWTEVDLAKFAGPGHWNDVDMLVVGVVGWSYEPLHETKLSPAEQYTHMSLWVLHAAPLILGCHVHEADDFTISLLTNDEVLAINQDPLGRGAKAVFTSTNTHQQVWARPLADGSKAVGLFNLDEVPVKVTAKWSDLGIKGKQKVRDVWRQKDLGTFENEFTAEPVRNGSMLLKFTPAK
jgi:alpha-galactosidase